MKVIQKIVRPKLQEIYSCEPFSITVEWAIYSLKDLKTVYESKTKSWISGRNNEYLICIEGASVEPKNLEWFLLNKESFEKKHIYTEKRNEHLFYHSYYHDFDCFLVKDTIVNCLRFIDTQNNIKWEVAEADVHYAHKFKDKLIIVQFKNNHLVVCVDIHSGNLDWSVDVSEIGKHIDSGKGRIGKVHSYKVVLYENIAIIPLVNWGNIGIDINSGKVIWQQKNKATWHSYQFGHLRYGISAFLYEYDARTGEMLRTKDIAEMLDMKNPRIWDAIVAIQGVSVSEKYIIFGNKGLVFIIDRLTFTLIETLEIDDINVGTYNGSPLYKDGMLYIVDSDNCLHVIKDENYSS